jgi:hypothetical protein
MSLWWVTAEPRLCVWVGGDAVVTSSFSLKRPTVIYSCLAWLADSFIRLACSALCLPNVFSELFQPKKKPLVFTRGFQFFWCPEEDSNLHTLRHTDLNRARLPIPPSGHALIVAWHLAQNCQEFTVERVFDKALCFRMSHATAGHKPLISIEFLENVDFPWRN